MGYALIWIEGLAAAVLWVALGAVWGARRQRRWLQWLIALSATLLPLALGVVAIWGAVGIQLEASGTLATDWTYYAVSWTLAWLVGAFLVLRWGLSRQGDEPAARNWSAGRLALLLGTAITLQAITLSNMDLAMKMQLASARSEAGAAMLTMTPQRGPEKDNAAPVYRQAFAALTPPDRLPPPWKKQSDQWLYPETAPSRPGESPPPFKPDPRDRELRDYLASQEPGLVLLRKAAALPGCWFDREPVTDTDSISPDVLAFPEVRQMNQGARVLALDARVKAASGDVKGSLANITAILGIARHMPTFMLSYPAAIGTEALGLRTLAEVLEQTEPEADDLAALPLEDQPYRAWLRREDAVLALICVAALATDPTSDRGRELFQWDKDVPGPLLTLLEGTALPLGRVFLAPDDLAAARRVLRDYRRGQSRTEDDRPLMELAEQVRTRRVGVFSMLYLTPKMRRLIHDTGDVASLRRLARTAVAAALYKAKKGKHAERMADLVPEYLPRAPVDPWDGEPLELHRLGEGVAVHAPRWGRSDSGPRWRNDTTPLVFRLR